MEDRFLKKMEEYLDEEFDPRNNTPLSAALKAARIGIWVAGIAGTLFVGWLVLAGNFIKHISSDNSNGAQTELVVTEEGNLYDFLSETDQIIVVDYNDPNKKNTLTVASLTDTLNSQVYTFSDEYLEHVLSQAEQHIQSGQSMNLVFE